MPSPFDWLPPAYRWATFLVLSASAVVLFSYLIVQGCPLRTREAPCGIVSLEVAWGKVQAEAVLGSWDSSRSTFTRQLRFDNVFLLIYPAAIALGCTLVAATVDETRRGVGAILAWAVLLCAPLDAVENIGMSLMFARGATPFLAGLVGTCAALKFIIIFSGVGYLVVLGGIALLRR